MNAFQLQPPPIQSCSTIIDRQHGDCLKHGRSLWTEAFVERSALSVAKRAPHRIALHSNRAACHLKLQSYKEAADECSAVLELDPKHAGALMLRAQTSVALKDYHSALFDVNRLLEIDPSSQVYRGLQARLKTQLTLPAITEEEEEEEEEEEDGVQPDSPSSAADRDAEALMNSFPTADENHPQPKGWDAIPKPLGHSQVNYSRWESLAHELSSDDSDSDEEEPQYMYRFRAIKLLSATQYVLTQSYPFKVEDSWQFGSLFCFVLSVVTSTATFLTIAR
ncbi:hypothetical protein R1flu_017775 [Riccia fluitans]|uniref:Uncharacterized protein n=1 Tax=Riccia fluitans TaxID=41844 RepID=A0ABD1ZE61_9MARC